MYLIIDPKSSIDLLTHKKKMLTLLNSLQSIKPEIKPT